MDDAERVRLAERAADLARDVGRALLGEVPGLADGPVERVPLQVLHRHVVDVVVGAAVVEDRDRVRVRELRRDAGLEEEALVKLGVVLARVVRVQDLERADAPERRLLGAVDLAHAAARDERGDLEAVVDDAADQRVRDPGALRDCRRPVGHDTEAPRRGQDPNREMAYPHTLECACGLTGCQRNGQEPPDCVRRSSLPGASSRSRRLHSAGLGAARPRTRRRERGRARPQSYSRAFLASRVVSLRVTHVARRRAQTRYVGARHDEPSAPASRASRRLRDARVSRRHGGRPSRERQRARGELHDQDARGDREQRRRGTSRCASTCRARRR